MTTRLTVAGDRHRRGAAKRRPAAGAGPAQGPRRRGPEGGGYAFTLVEILIVVLIIAIAAAVAIPNIGTTADLQALSAARMVMADLQYAQNYAVTTQQAIRMDFDPGSSSYRLTQDDSESTPLKHPMNKSDFVVNFSQREGLDRVRITSATFGTTDTVTFDPMGSPDNGGSITLAAGQRQYRIDVSVGTGRITVTPLGS